MTRRFALILTVLPIAFASPAALGEGTDELWEITMKMEMAGMPAMPAHTVKTCKRKGDRNPDMDRTNDRSDCKATDVRTAGAKTTWKMVCTKPDPMTGTGEMTHSGDKFDGIMKMSGQMEGQPFNMTQNMSGKKVGSCTYEDPAKKVKEMQTQNQAAIAKECDKQIEELNPLLFFGGANLPPESLLCKDRKADFCARSVKLAQQMREPAAFAEANGKYRDWREAMKACGTDAAAVSAAACKAGVDKKNWNFVAEYCPAEAKVLAQKHCVGFDYTNAMASEYVDICRGFGAEVAKEKTAAPKPEAATASASGDAKDAKQPITATDAIKEGASKLKKLFKP
jgi:hypothetical protein